MLKFVLSFVFLFAVQSHAQNTTTSRAVLQGQVPQFSDLYNRFGAGISFSPISGKVTSKSQTPGITGSSSDTESGKALGVEAHYMTFLNGPLGVKAALGYMKSDIEDADLKTIMAKTSGLVALNGQAVLELGLNVSKTKVESISLDAGIGFQLGINYLINRNAMFNVSYVNFSSDKDFRDDSYIDEIGKPLDYNTELKLSGLQAGISYLF
ncbi:MAG: hypothetical protein V4596_12500 [Bdellovibrionota bacterium]